MASNFQSKADKYIWVSIIGAPTVILAALSAYFGYEMLAYEKLAIDGFTSGAESNHGGLNALITLAFGGAAAISAERSVEGAIVTHKLAKGKIVGR